MAVIHHSDDLLQRLPAVRGKIKKNVKLSKLTWFRVGGPAEVLFWPADEADLAEFLASLPRDIPLTILGVGSNTLVRDGGVPGVSIRLSSGFQKTILDGAEITAGAGISNLKLANFARAKNISGLEFLCGIPGSLGGSIKMNSGAFNRQVEDILVDASALSRSGKLVSLPASKMNFDYRQIGVSPGLIFVGAKLRGNLSNLTQINERMIGIQTERQASQPIKRPTGGSTFTNPPGTFAWKLIDMAGCRGLRRGGAQVSTKHCNFLINLGGATAADLEELGEEVRDRVFDVSGIRLRWEIERIGVPHDHNLEEVKA